MGVDDNSGETEDLPRLKGLYLEIRLPVLSFWGILEWYTVHDKIRKTDITLN